MEYGYNDSIQLTPHFNIQEFKCKCGTNHPIKHNPMLSEKLEQVFNKLDCSAIVVNSGHRCSAYDVYIGGSGTGQHIEGNAADIVCYDKDNNRISSKLVSCVAQDVGFGGIANIDWQYNAAHVDVRESNFWYGDEVVTTAKSVTNDFYAYYGIDRNGISNNTDNTNNTPTDTLYKGVDLAYCQDSVHWDSLDIDFCIVQAGYGRESWQKDKMFESHYSNAKKHNIPVGAYWYSYASTVEDAYKEAQACLEVIKGKQFELPIYYDVEEASQFNKGKQFVSDVIRAFCSTLEKAGYFVGVYMSSSYLNNYVDDDIKNNYTIWVADYNSKAPNYNKPYDIWQYSGSGYINGIATEVDLDYCYRDFPSIIKNSNLNGYTKKDTIPEKPIDTNTDKPIVNKDKHSVTVEIDGKTYKGELEDVTNSK